MSNDNFVLFIDFLLCLLECLLPDLECEFFIFLAAVKNMFYNFFLNPRFALPAPSTLQAPILFLPFFTVLWIRNDLFRIRIQL